MNRTIFVGLLLYWGVSLLAGCSFQRNKASMTPVASATWFSKIKTQVIEPKCERCHNASHAADDVDLSSYQSLMDAHVVVPFNPEDSGLYQAVSSDYMPMNSDPLSEDEKTMIHAWILAGASETDPIPTAGPSEPPPPVKEEVDEREKFAWIQANIFVPKCLRCHQPPKAKGGIDFSSYEALLASKGKKLGAIVPLKPEESAVVEQVAKKLMPPGPTAPKLTDEEVLFITKWIAAGAEEN